MIASVVARSSAAGAGCWDDLAASRPSRPHPRSGKPSKAEILDAAQAPAVGLPLSASAFADPNLAAPRAAQAPCRSSAVPSPQAPPEKSSGVSSLSGLSRLKRAGLGGRTGREHIRGTSYPI